MKRLLVHSGSSIRQLAEIFSFHKPDAFVKFVKRENGLTPNRLREDSPI